MRSRITRRLLLAADAIFLTLLMWGPVQVNADCYIQHPRGSNNKLNEQQNNVRNNRRLFDSQNNDNSGYQVGDACVPNCLNGANYNSNKPGAGEGIMEYYEDSQLYIEWTNQHGSQNPRLHNQIILQYMCEDGLYSSGLRDGKTTDRIPYDQTVSNIMTYGQHETRHWWDLCKTRQRNMGLFTADQNLAGLTTAIHTRQDTNGNNDRYGFECPEERDYYPYWHPSPWRDIWVCTDTPYLCPFYQSESQNVMNKGNCSDPQYNNQKDCEYNKNTWTTTGAWNIPAPECTICPSTRNNHNGNQIGSDQAPFYIWRVPKGVHEDGTKCVLRIRYNVSTYDFTDYWNTFSNLNGANSPTKTNPASDFIGFGGNVSGPLRLAINTDQNPRTFEDRTHVFRIRKRPANLDCGLRSPSCEIINFNVRGRRGNIQQVYPAVEYDFVPPVVNAVRGDYLHIQWTGADSNAQGNAGQGRAGTDRNNLVVIGNLGKNVPLNMNPLDYSLRPNHFTSNNSMIATLAFLNQTGCDDNTADTQSDQNCKVINAAPGYFNAGLVRLDNTGTFYLMSTRNNQFSNREQKSVLTVSEDSVTIAGSVVITVGGAGAFALLFFIGFGYAKKHPESKLNKLYGTNKPIVVGEFDDDDVETANSKEPEKKKPLTERYPFIGRLYEWYQWNSSRVWFIVFFILANGAIYVYGYTTNLGVSPSPYFAYAKGFGKMLDFNLSFVLIPVLRNFLSFLRASPITEVLPLDDNLKIHRWTAYTILLSAGGHITFHYFNFVWLRDNQAQSIAYNSLGTRPGLTGQFVTLFMIMMFVTALIKRKIFNIFGRRFDGYRVFLNIHRLWMVIYPILWIHGSAFWTFSIFPLMFMMIEKFIQLRRVNLDVQIIEASMVGRDVLGLKMRLVNSRKKFRYKAGQYLFLNCPDINENEFHPFTITSAPEDSYFSCHIRCKADMDWTFRLRQQLGFAETIDAAGKTVPARNIKITEDNRTELGVPLLRVDGPYGSASEEVFDFDTVVLVGAGIGVTPFISILKSISMRIKARQADHSKEAMQVYFYWICRDQAEFDSFKDLFDQITNIQELSAHLELNMYVTGELNLKTLRVEKYNQFSGKPNWNRVFKEKAAKHQGEDIGVFLCGPSAIAKELKVACKTNSTKIRLGAEGEPRTVFKFHKENF